MLACGHRRLHHVEAEAHHALSSLACVLMPKASVAYCFVGFVRNGDGLRERGLARFFSPSSLISNEWFYLSKWWGFISVSSTEAGVEYKWVKWVVTRCRSVLVSWSITTRTTESDTVHPFCHRLLLSVVKSVLQVQHVRAGARSPAKIASCNTYYYFSHICTVFHSSSLSAL